MFQVKAPVLRTIFWCYYGLAAGLLQMEMKTIITAKLLHHTFPLPAVSWSETNNSETRTLRVTWLCGKESSSWVSRTLFCYNITLHFLPIPKTVSQSSLQCCNKKCLKTSEPIEPFASLPCLSQCIKNINTWKSSAQVHTAHSANTYSLLRKDKKSQSSCNKSGMPGESKKLQKPLRP